MRLIDKINEFESGTETVSSFNSIFTNNPIFGFDVDDIVTIGEIDGPETTRIITVTGNLTTVSFRHDFTLADSDRKIVINEEEEDNSGDHIWHVGMDIGELTDEF